MKTILFIASLFISNFVFAQLNSAPMAFDDIAYTNEDNPVSIVILANDNDVDGNIDISTVAVIYSPVNGTVTVDSLEVIYTPDLNFYGIDSVAYMVCDNGTPILCDSAWIIVTVYPVNDAPIAVNDFAITYQYIPVSIDVTANDYDVDPFGGIDQTTVVVLTNPQNGVESIYSGEITYTPDIIFFGIDSLQYIVCDSGYPLPPLCDTAWVYIDVLDLSIEGTLSTSSSNPLQNSKVYLIDYISATDSVFAVDSTFTDASGYYQFTGAFQNAYVKAVPDVSNYPNEIPTYYTSSAVFLSATSISITGGVTNVSFSSIAGVNPGGNGFISGIVGNGAGKNTEVGLPISGLSLVLMNENMEVVKQTTTNAQGQFSFDDLEEAEFSIWVDKAGINNLVAPSISLVAESSKEDLQFILHEDYLEYKTNVSIKNISESKFKVFPNPTNGLFSIQSENVDFSMEMYNILGEKVLYENDLTGNVVLDLTKNNVAKGTYIMKISNKEGNFYSKLVYR